MWCYFGMLQSLRDVYVLWCAPAWVDTDARAFVASRHGFVDSTAGFVSQRILGIQGHVRLACFTRDWCDWHSSHMPLMYCGRTLVTNVSYDGPSLCLAGHIRQTYGVAHVGACIVHSYENWQLMAQFWVVYFCKLYLINFTLAIIKNCLCEGLVYYFNFLAIFSTLQ